MRIYIRITTKRDATSDPNAGANASAHSRAHGTCFAYGAPAYAFAHAQPNVYASGAYGAYGARCAYGSSAYASACTHAIKQMRCLWVIFSSYAYACAYAYA